MPTTVLGLDIGGANLKAATADRRARLVPFALWKQPEQLAAALTALVAEFPDATEFAVTMTGELCDCYATKREGVAAILAAAQAAAGGRVRVWSTEGKFLNSDEAEHNHLKVAAANWHALATLVGRYVHIGRAILVDVGSTTTDIIPILDGKPVSCGLTDQDRMKHKELIYTGVRRTPVCSVPGGRLAAEFFATTQDAYLLLGRTPENSADCDTADGRPATRAAAHARMSRMLGGDAETVSLEDATVLARDVMRWQVWRIRSGVRRALVHLDRQMKLEQRESSAPVEFIISGSGEFLARKLLSRGFKRAKGDWVRVTPDRIHSLTDRLGPEVSVCAPAYALAVLATEGQGM